MKSGNRHFVPEPHTIAAVAWTVASVAIVVTILASVYFALGRPDTTLIGDWFSQLASGARKLTSVMPASDSTIATVLRTVVTGVVVAFVVVIGGIGAWDAWQSRQRRARDPSAIGREPELGIHGRDAAGSPPLASDAETFYSPDIARARIRRSYRASNDPDTLQGGTA
jgi:hypothetical protein